MKILVVCQYYYPEEFQINNICEELVRKGNKVTVLTGLPNYPTGVIPEEYKGGKRRQEEINGVNVIRCWEIPREKGIIGLALNYISFCLSGSVKAFSLGKDFDVVYIYQLSPVLMAIPGIIYKVLHKKKIYLYCLDLWPESLKLYKIKERTILYKITKFICGIIYNQCEIIGITTPAFKEYFQKTHGIIDIKLIYIPQYANEEYLQQDFYETHESFNFMFMGNVGMVQNLDTVVRAMELIKNTKNIRIHVVGDGSYLNDLKTLVKEKELDEYFVFHGRKPSCDMPIYYKIADVCLLTLKSDGAVGNTIPGKLQGYMAAGKPVLGAINGDAQRIIRESGCGTVVDADDYKALARSMMEFIEQKEFLRQYGDNGRDYFKNNFTKDKYIYNTLKILNNMIEVK